MRKLKVRHFINDIYEVVEIKQSESNPDEDVEVKVYQGKIEDCEAYVRLYETN